MASYRLLTHGHGDVSYIWDTLVVASERRCGCRGQVSFVAADDLLWLDMVS
jgi:hypothetical protein